MQKPNAFIHMTLWGFVGGAILGAIYAVSLTFIDSFIRRVFSFFEALSAGAFYGGFAGLVLGAFCGVILWAGLHHLQPPIDKNLLLTYQKRVSWAFAIITFVGMFIVSPVFLLGAANDLFIIVPPIVAGFGAFTVTRRYFTKLATYSEKGKRKPKVA